jgi:hypothetical protein
MVEFITIKCTGVKQPCDLSPIFMLLKFLEKTMTCKNEPIFVIRGRHKYLEILPHSICSNRRWSTRGCRRVYGVKTGWLVKKEKKLFPCAHKTENHKLAKAKQPARWGDLQKKVDYGQDRRAP